MAGIRHAALVTAGAIAGTIAIDQVSKLAVERTLHVGERTDVAGIPLERRANDRGISGTERGGGTNAALLGTGVALALGIAGAGAWFGRGGGAAGTVLAAGTGMLAGGMAANLFDRATKGQVTDFLPSPLGVINVADAALAGGIVTAGLGAALVALR